MLMEDQLGPDIALMCDGSLPHKVFPVYHHMITPRVFIWTPSPSPQTSPSSYCSFRRGVVFLSVYYAKVRRRPHRKCPALGPWFWDPPWPSFPSFLTETCPAPPVWKIPPHNVAGRPQGPQVRPFCRHLRGPPVARGCGPSLSPLPAQSADRKRRSHTSAAIALVAGSLRRTHGVICVQGCPRSDQGWARGTRLETPSWWVGSPVGATPQGWVGRGRKSSGLSASTWRAAPPLPLPSPLPALLSPFFAAVEPVRFDFHSPSPLIGPRRERLDF